MKKLLYLLCFVWAGSFLTGCSEEEIALYDQEMAITFSSATTLNYTFTDEHYLNGTTSLELNFYAQLQGGLVDANRTFCLKTEPREGYSELPVLQLENPYTYSETDTNIQVYPLVAQRPEKPSTTQSCLLTFDYANPAHQFIKGRVDISTLTVNVTYKIKPSTWRDEAWGTYSDAKYMFMMDVLDKTYSSMMDYELRTVVDAYEAYKAEGGDPICDDNNEEITFPETNVNA